MYTKYVDALAQHASKIFSSMTGTEVLSHKVKIDERQSERIPLAHVISYEHMDRPVKGNFILGFASQAVAVSVAAALAENMGLPASEDLDEIAADLLNEFMNTIVGRTISEWDRMGMPVKFGPPQSIKFSSFQVQNASVITHAYVVILGLTFSHVVFRVTFSEEGAQKPRGQKILVVEDSAVIRNIIARTLQEFHFTVRQAENGRRAVELFKEFKPDLTLMDLVMPEMGGMEAIEAILDDFPGAKFIVLTSTSRRDQVMTAKKLGVKAYLIKPFNPDLLMRELNKALAAEA